MSETMNQSQEIDKIALALAKAQGEYLPAHMDSTAYVKSDKGNYTFKYASLGAIVAAIRPALSKYEIAITHPLNSNGSLVVGTRLLHSSGQWIEASFATAAERGSGNQAIGSAITYARRYTLCAVAGIVAEEDDDANAADGNRADIQRKPVASPPTASVPLTTSAPAAKAAFPYLGTDAVAADPVNAKAAATFKEWSGQQVTALGGGEVGRGELAKILGALADKMGLPRGPVANEDDARKFRDEFVPAARAAVNEVLDNRKEVTK